MKANRWPTVLWLCAHGVAWGTFLLALTIGVRRFEVIVADLGLPVPFVSRMIISISHLAFRLAPLIPLLLVAFLAGDWSVLDALGGRGEVIASVGWPWLVLVVPLLMLGVTLAGLGLMVLDLGSHLSG